MQNGATENSGSGGEGFRVHRGGTQLPSSGGRYVGRLPDPKAVQRIAVFWVGAMLSLAGASPAQEQDRPPPEPLEVIVQPASHCITAEEAGLSKLVNEYRAQNGLSGVPLSRALTEVAKSHVFDLQVNGPRRQADAQGRSCSLHSWSESGPWRPVCYTPQDRSCGEAMRTKPRELTGNAYAGGGFENVYWTSKPLRAKSALEAWMKSPAHNALILQQGCWARAQWAAMGVAIFESFAVLWFGDVSDETGAVQQCETDRSKFLQSLIPTTEGRR